MAKIEKTDNGITVDGEPVDMSAIATIEDRDLEDISGGVRIVTKYKIIGGSCAKCGSCGSKDFTIVGVAGDEYPKNTLIICCNKCGSMGYSTIKG